MRTSDEAVRATVDADAALNLAPFIARAGALTDYVASRDTQGLLTTALLREIETCLAAHFYAHRDPQYRSKSTGGASASFQGQSGMHLEGTDWGQDAMTLDVTGVLASLNRGRASASGIWLGKAPSEQTDYEDRD